MKQISQLTLAAMTFFVATIVHANIWVQTNTYLIPSNGIFEGKVSRVIVNPATKTDGGSVGVFISGDQYMPGEIGVIFDGSDFPLGLSLVTGVNKPINITTIKQDNGDLLVTGFAMNQ